jgi:hypothetical protein
MRLLKYILNILFFMWLYQRMVKPLLNQYFPSAPQNPKPNNPTSHQNAQDIQIKPRSNNKDNDGDYIDYEEIKK